MIKKGETSMVPTHTEKNSQSIIAGNESLNNTLNEIGSNQNEGLSEVVICNNDA